MAANAASTLPENARMKLLSYAYRFLSNFVFLALSISA
jgi:hypothetical protein